MATRRPHPDVRHPRELIARELSAIERWNDAVLDWVTDHILGSIIIFDIALVVPLVCWNASDSTKITLGLISGSWLQWWALHGIQRRAMKADALRDAKIEADHHSTTHIATTLDEIAALLRKK